MSEPSKEYPIPLPEHQRCSLDAGESYGSAQAKIESLEEELRNKREVLDKFLQDQLALRENLHECLKYIQHSYSLFKTAKSDFNHQRQQLNDYIETLLQENEDLKLANEAWINRSIKQEFEVINAREEITRLETALDLAISKITLLENKLKSANP